MSENVDNEEGIPEGITGDFSLNKLLAKEAEKIKKRQGITGDHSLGELLDMENEKDGFALTEQKTTTDEKQARQELSKKHVEEVKLAQEELTNTITEAIKTLPPEMLKELTLRGSKTTKKGKTIIPNTVSPRPKGLSIFQNKKEFRDIQEKQKEWDARYSETHNRNGTKKGSKKVRTIDAPESATVMPWEDLTNLLDFVTERSAKRPSKTFIKFNINKWVKDNDYKITKDGLNFYTNKLYESLN